LDDGIQGNPRKLKTFFLGIAWSCVSADLEVEEAFLYVSMLFNTANVTVDLRLPNAIKASPGKGAATD
jgi:hypothetical protein